MIKTNIRCKLGFHIWNGTILIRINGLLEEQCKGCEGILNIDPLREF